MVVIVYSILTISLLMGLSIGQKNLRKNLKKACK
jgi:hypothetical protein